MHGGILSHQDPARADPLSGIRPGRCPLMASAVPPLDVLVGTVSYQGLLNASVLARVSISGQKAAKQERQLARQG